MQYFLYSILILCLCGCSSIYKDLKESGSTSCTAAQFTPSYGVALYDAEINVVNKHLSGLLLIKKMPDKSLRTIFSSETGLTYFDFEYPPDSGFIVHSVLKQMNKKAVISTLRKDFELVLMNRLDSAKAKSLQDEQNAYQLYEQGKENIYVVTDLLCSRLERIELASRKKPKVQVSLRDYEDGIPSAIYIIHRNFKFDISLKKIKH